MQCSLIKYTEHDWFVKDSDTNTVFSLKGLLVQLSGARQPDMGQLMPLETVMLQEGFMKERLTLGLEEWVDFQERMM